MKKIGEILLEDKVITQEQLNDALLKQKKSGGKKIGEILIEEGYLTMETLLLFLEHQINHI